MLYTYYDFETAYYKNMVYECKEIGLYLLKKIKTKEAQQYYKLLKPVEGSGDMSPQDHKFIAQLLRDIKNYLKVNL